MLKYENLMAICKRVLQRHSNDIEALNKLQLIQGKVLAEGQESLKGQSQNLPAYSNRYLKTRKKFNRPLAPMDLFLTGDFQRSFYTEFYGDSAEIGSRDFKEAKLEARFPELHGLTNESRDKLLWEYGVAEEITQELVNETEIFQ